MSQEDLEKQLLSALKKLEGMSDRILSTRGYTAETKRVRALEELIKEQIKNENLSHTARPIR